MDDSITIKISNIDAVQYKRIVDFLSCWQYLGEEGSSKRTEFHIYGDTVDKFQIKVDGKAIEPDKNAVRRYIKWS